MKKKILLAMFAMNVMALAVMSTPGIITAQQVNENSYEMDALSRYDMASSYMNYKYLKTYEGTVEILTYEEEEGVTEATIPSQINGINVTDIDSYAFKDCSNLTRITIPDTVDCIFNHAFEGCSGLTNIEIADSVCCIFDGAFQDCRNLTNVRLPKELDEIYPKTFSGCTKLKSLEIPVTVTEIDAEAFENCNNLEHIFYTGSKAQWKKIEIANKGNKSLKKAIIHYNSSMPKPKATNLSGLTAKEKAVDISWKKQMKQVDGYEIQYAGNKDFNNAKIITIENNKTVSTTVDKLKRNKKYYLRVRTYTNVENKMGKSTKFYSDWSKTKSVKIR